MSEPFVGEIRMFAGNFAPRGWAFCDGQLLAVTSNEALFSLFGTIYGGDGRTTFGLPDLRGRVPIHAGSGSGLSSRRLGSRAGAENVTIAVNSLPSHTHIWRAASASAQNRTPVGNTPASASSATYGNATSLTALNAATVSAASGGGRSHTNLMPFCCIHFIIALFGIFPSRQ